MPISTPSTSWSATRKRFTSSTGRDRGAGSGCRGAGLRDLAALDATLAEDLATERERWACLRAYLKHSQGKVKQEAGSRLAQRLRRETACLLRRRRIRELRQKPLPAGTHNLVWLDGEALCVTRDFRAELQGQVPAWLKLANRPAWPVDRLIQTQVPTSGVRQATLIRAHGPSTLLRAMELAAAATLVGPGDPAGGHALQSAALPGADPARARLWATTGSALANGIVSAHGMSAADRWAERLAGLRRVARALAAAASSGRLTSADARGTLPVGWPPWGASRGSGESLPLPGAGASGRRTNRDPRLRPVHAPKTTMEPGDGPTGPGGSLAHAGTRTPQQNGPVAAAARLSGR